MKLTPHPHVTSLSLHSMTVKMQWYINNFGQSECTKNIFCYVLKRFSSVSDQEMAVSYINLVIKVLMLIILLTPVAAVVPSLD